MIHLAMMRSTFQLPDERLNLGNDFIKIDYITCQAFIQKKNQTIHSNLGCDCLLSIEKLKFD